MPVGKGKKFGGNSGPWLDRLIGGWQLSGFGTWSSNYWSLPTSNYGVLGNVEIHGLKYPIQDCRSGRCIPGYLYWNGYIQPGSNGIISLQNSANSARTMQLSGRLTW